MTQKSYVALFRLRFLKTNMVKDHPKQQRLLLKPGPGPWTLKNLDPEKHGKQLDMEK